MRVDWCVSSWFRIKNTHTHEYSLTHSPLSRPGWGAYNIEGRKNFKQKTYQKTMKP